jgi:hypothetical protein
MGKTRPPDNKVSYLINQKTVITARLTQPTLEAVPYVYTLLFPNKKFRFPKLQRVF